MSPRFQSFAIVLTAVLASGIAGCRWVTVDPLGDETTVSGSWTVEGGSASVAACDAVGIDEVRLAIIDGGSVYYDNRLTAPCSAGLIDTRPFAVLNSGTYGYRWEGYLRNVRVAMGPERTLVAPFDGHVMVNSIDFVASGSFNPIGTDASVEAHWTVEHTTPSTASCNALGIDRVRIAFFDGATAREFTTLTAPCASGSFDTRPERVIRAGTWTVQFQAVDRAGTVLGAGAMVTVSVAAGGHLSLYDGAPVDFSGAAFNPVGTDATLLASWMLNDRSPTVNTCFAVGGTTVRVLLHPATDLDFNEGLPVAMANCSLGIIDTPMPVIRAGTYLASVEMLDESGDQIVSYVPTMTPFTVTAGSDVMIGAANFTFPLTLTVGLDWQRGLGGPPGNCTEAGIATMGYMLINEATATSLIGRVAVPCAELLSFEPGLPAGFGTGSYRLYFEGTGADGIKHWIVMSGTCDGIVVDNTNSIVYEQCFADYR